MKRKVCVAFVMSLALMAAAGCVSESMTALSDRVFDRAAEQFVLMDSNLAEGEFPRSLDTLGNLVTSDSKWWCCGFFPGAGEGFQTRDIVIGEGEEYEENLKAMNENRLSCTINISYGDFDYHSGGDIQGSSANSTRPWRNVEKFVGEFIGETDVVLANHHAYSDAMYEPFVKAVTPQVCIIPVWDYYHPQPTTLDNMLRGGIDEDHPAVRDSVNYVFAAGMVGSNRERLAGDGALVLPDGHVVVRVYEGGDRFQVFVLDDGNTNYDVIYRTPVLKSRN